MNKLWLLGAALSAAALGTSVYAQQESVTVPAPHTKIEVPEHTYHMPRSDFEVFRGGYDLSNGQTLKLTHSGTAMYAEIDKEGRHRIVATGHDSFVALDRKLQMKIDWHPDGSVGGEVLIAVPTRNLATGEMEDQVIRFAMR